MISNKIMVPVFTLTGLTGFMLCITALVKEPNIYKMIFLMLQGLVIMALSIYCMILVNKNMKG